MSDVSTPPTVSTPSSTAGTTAPPAPWARGPGRPIAIIVVTAVVAVGIAFAGVALGSSKRSPNATITVTGSGTVKGTPDTVSFQIGVQTVDPTAAGALAANNRRTLALERALRRHGVTNQDMQTSDLDIYENTNDNGVLTGFTVTDDLNVTLHKVSDAGAAIDAAANAAGNGIQLYGITFSISNDSTLLAQARARAMQNAKTEASDIARGGGTTVGAIVRITDQENSGGSVVYPLVDQSFATAASNVPVEAGSQSINVQVTVVYSLAS